MSDAVISLTIFIFECPFVSQDNVTKRKQERENIDFSMVSFFQTFFREREKEGVREKYQKQKAKKKADVRLGCDHIRRCSFGSQF